jgi:hypothetical protein
MRFKACGPALQSKCKKNAPTDRNNPTDKRKKEVVPTD